MRPDLIFQNFFMTNLSFLSDFRFELIELLQFKPLLFYFFTFLHRYCRIQPRIPMVYLTHFIRLIQTSINGVIEFTRDCAFFSYLLYLQFHCFFSYYFFTFLVLFNYCILHLFYTIYLPILSLLFNKSLTSIRYTYFLYQKKSVKKVNNRGRYGERLFKYPKGLNFYRQKTEQYGMALKCNSLTILFIIQITLSDILSMEEKFQALYILQKKGQQHMASKRYSWAMVFLCDALKDFQTEIDRVENSEEMEKLIRDIKVPCHKHLSLSYLKQGNYENCIQQCKDVLEIQPNNVEILYRIGLSFLNLYNVGQAQAYLRKAFFLSPNDKQIMKALNRIQELSFSPKKRQKRGKQVQKAEQQISWHRIAILWPIMVFIFFWNLLMGKRKTEKKL